MSTPTLAPRPSAFSFKDFLSSFMLVELFKGLAITGKYAFSLYLDKGPAIYESGKIGKLAPEVVKVETPKATVGVRGTRFLIETD